MPSATRRDALRAISTGGAVLTSGCTTVVENESDDDSNGVAEDDSNGGSNDVPECSDAEITAVDFRASTSGDRVIVEGTVYDLPAPSLKGHVVHLDGGERKEDAITERLETTGQFTESFEYGHHGIEEYEFWLEGCGTPTSKG